MLQNWLCPSSVFQETAFENLPSSAIRKNINVYSSKEDMLQNVQVALIGVDTSNADAIRRAFYPLAYNFPTLNIVDLGNLKKDTTSFIIPVLKELHDVDIIPVLLGGQTSHIYAQYQAHYAKRQLTNIAVVDERIHFDLGESDSFNYLNKIAENRKLFNLSVIASQSHFTPLAISKYFSNRFFESFGLGRVRKNIEELEPTLRDADLLAFNIPAIRSSDTMGQGNASPNGLFGEEACQIVRYAGLSDKLSSFGVYGYETNKDFAQQSAALIAQMVWYFLDGIQHRKHDFPKSTDNLVEYIVEQKQLDHQITFWKSTKSGRWWMQVPIKTRKKHQRHKLIPCSLKDYQMASKGELPKRLMAAYQRFL